MRKSIFAMAGAMLLTAALAVPALAASFSNGSFEQGSYAGGGFVTLPGGSTAIDRWTVGGHSIDWIGSHWQPADGSKSIDLAGNGPGSVSQTFDTTVNATYVVEFKMAGNPDGAPATKTLRATAAGVESNFSFDTKLGIATRTSMGWEDRSFSFKANAVLTTLTFESTVAGPYGAAIDKVVVTETLPTGAECKKGGWETMVDKLSVPFKNQGDCVSYYATGERNLANPKDDL